MKTCSTRESSQYTCTYIHGNHSIRPAQPCKFNSTHWKLLIFHYNVNVTNLQKIIMMMKWQDINSNKRVTKKWYDQEVVNTNQSWKSSEIFTIRLQEALTTHFSWHALSYLVSKTLPLPTCYIMTRTMALKFQHKATSYTKKTTPSLVSIHYYSWPHRKPRFRIAIDNPQLSIFFNICCQHWMLLINDGTAQTEHFSYSVWMGFLIHT